MKGTLLIFVSLLISARMTRQFTLPSDVTCCSSTFCSLTNHQQMQFLKIIHWAKQLFHFLDYSKVALSEDYLEKYKENEEDAEHNPETSARTPVFQLDHEQDLLKKSLQNLQEPSKLLSNVGDEEESSQQEDTLESRFGPHYHNILTQNHSEEEPLDVSDNADLLQRNATEQTSREDFKVHVMLIASSIALVIYLIFVIFFCVTIIKHRMQKGNFCRIFRCSRDQQRPASEARGGIKALDMQSDSHKKGSNSETVPLMSSVVDMPSIPDEPNHSDTPSSED